VKNRLVALFKVGPSQRTVARGNSLECYHEITPLPRYNFVESKKGIVPDGTDASDVSRKVLHRQDSLCVRHAMT
jgi:hypothetical protein